MALHEDGSCDLLQTEERRDYPPRLGNSVTSLSHELGVEHDESDGET